MRRAHESAFMGFLRGRLQWFVNLLHVVGAVFGVTVLPRHFQNLTNDILDIVFLYLENLTCTWTSEQGTGTVSASSRSLTRRPMRLENWRKNEENFVFAGRHHNPTSRILGRWSLASMSSFV